MAPFPLICVRFTPHISTFFPSTGLQADRLKSKHGSRTSDRSSPFFSLSSQFLFLFVSKRLHHATLQVLISLFLRQWEAGTGSELTATVVCQ